MAEKDKPQTKSEAPKKEQTGGERVRILSTDIDGTRGLLVGLSKIKGVGHNLANAIVFKLGMDPTKKLTALTDPEIEKIEKAIADPKALGIPEWMYNRRKDLETGGNIHINTSDLSFALKTDLDVLGEIKSYRGLRHARHLKLRGQRTKSTGRGTSSVGVKRKNK